MRKCELYVKDLAKAMERLTEAVQAYVSGRYDTALAKIGAAFTSLALAYSKGVIDKEKWKELSGALYSVRDSILSFDPMKEVVSKGDSVRDKIMRALLEKYQECIERGGNV